MKLMILEELPGTWLKCSRIFSFRGSSRSAAVALGRGKARLAGQSGKIPERTEGLVT